MGFAPQKGTIMDAKSSKRTLKAAALAAGLIAVLLPTGCSTTPDGTIVYQQALGSPDTVVAPPTVD